MKRRRTVPQWRIHLTPSRMLEWIGCASYDVRHPSSTWRGRLRQVEQWNRQGPKDPYERAVTTPGRAFPWLAYGTHHEAGARDAYLALTGIDPALCERAYFREHDDMPWVGTAPDLLVGDNGLLEIKCPYSLRDSNEEDCALRTEWLLQAYLHLEVFDRAWCDILAYNGTYLWLWRLHRDGVEYHTPFVADADATPASPTAVATATLDDEEPVTLWMLLKPELMKYPRAVAGELCPHAWLGAPHDFVLRRRHAMSELRSNALAQLAAPATADGFLTWKMGYETQTNPNNFTLIDRVANPLAPPANPLETRFFAGRYMYVLRTGPGDDDFWKSSADGDPFTVSGRVTMGYHRCLVDGQPVGPEHLARGAEAWGVVSATKTTS